MPLKRTQPLTDPLHGLTLAGGSGREASPCRVIDLSAIPE